jgi:hypothetical protein
LQQGSTDEVNREIVELKLGNIDRKLHKAIELDQLILLIADILKEKIEKGSIDDRISISEELEKIMSNSAQNAVILKEVRRILNEKPI